MPQITKDKSGLIHFDHQELQNLARGLTEQYASAAPFPHVVIDDFVPVDFLREVVREFATPDSPIWSSFIHQNSRKCACNDLDRMGQKTRHLLEQLNSLAMTSFLEMLTGISHIIPDVHYEGGGLHQISNGGFLNIHADFNTHRRWNLDRRLNLLLFLNEHWHDAWGGHFEMWDSDMQHCMQKVAPIFNRCVIFSTTDRSFHGHPDPLKTPDGVTRKSLALYFYTNGRPAEEQTSEHSTLYQQRPSEQGKRP